MITDWAGNEIKAGMEVAFLQTEIHHSRQEMLLPGGCTKDGKPYRQVLQEAHDEPCWILSEFMVVEGMKIAISADQLIQAPRLSQTNLFSENIY